MFRFIIIYFFTAVLLATSSNYISELVALADLHML